MNVCIQPVLSLFILSMYLIIIIIINNNNYNYYACLFVLLVQHCHNFMTLVFCFINHLILDSVTEHMFASLCIIRILKAVVMVAYFMRGCCVKQLGGAGLFKMSSYEDDFRSQSRRLSSEESTVSPAPSVSCTESPFTGT